MSTIIKTRPREAKCEHCDNTRDSRERDYLIDFYEWPNKKYDSYVCGECRDIEENKDE